MYFWKLIWTAIKSPLGSPLMWAGVAFCTGICLLLGVVTPQQSPAAAYGVYPVGKTAHRAVDILRQRPVYTMVLYDSRAALEQDVLRGVLHCAYVLEDGAEAPVTSIGSENAYLRPALDKLAAGAYFEASAQDWTQAYLSNRGLDTTDFDAAWQQAQAAQIPLTASITYGGVQTTGAEEQPTPLGNLSLVSAYSLIPVLALAAALSRNVGQEQALLLLSRQKGMVQTFLGWGVGLTIWFMLALGFSLVVLCAAGVQSWDVLTKGAVGGAALGLVCAAVYTLGSFCRRYKGLLLGICPLWAAASIMGGGGIISPQSLPYGLSILRWISPASLLQWNF